MSVQSASGAAAASGSAARSSEFAATPPTIATCSRPACSAASRTRLDERAHDRALVRRGEVGAARFELRLVEVAHRVEQRRLEAGEREVEAVDARDREVVRLGIAVAREAVDLPAAGIAEAEEARALVERLARGVVARRAEHLAIGVRADVEEQRVPAAREEAEERRLERVRLEVERGDVPVEVVDRDERQPPRPRERLRGGEPDEQRADQPRPLRHGDAVDVVERRARLGERLADHRRDELEVAPRRDLGHDAAVPRVEVRLRGDDARANLSVLRDERRRGLVAARLDPEDHAVTRRGCVGSATGSFHMMSASSRLSV